MANSTETVIGFTTAKMHPLRGMVGVYVGVPTSPCESVQRKNSENTKMQKKGHTEKPKYTEKVIKSKYMIQTKKQTAKHGYRNGVKTKRF